MPIRSVRRNERRGRSLPPREVGAAGGRELAAVAGQRVAACPVGNRRAAQCDVGEGGRRKRREGCCLGWPGAPPGPGCRRRSTRLRTRSLQPGTQHPAGHGSQRSCRLARPGTGARAPTGNRARRPWPPRRGRGVRKLPGSAGRGSRRMPSASETRSMSTTRGVTAWYRPLMLMSSVMPDRRNASLASVSTLAPPDC
jgi:hypothetical protein